MAVLTPIPRPSPSPHARATTRRAAEPRRVHPFVVVVASLVLAGLMNAPALVETATRQPLGWRRDVLLDVATAVADVAETTRLDRPRRWLESILGNEHPKAAPSTPGAPTPTTPTVPGPTTAPVPGTAPPSTGTPPGTVEPGRGRPTIDEPLRLWIVGDSMMQVVGQSLVSAATGTELIDPHLEYRVSTGLTRPDYFDWPARLAALLETERPEAIVVMFGANDAQGIVTAAGAEPFGTDAWVAEYRARVDAVMDLLAAGGLRAYWVGQPVMRSASFSARMALLDEVYRAAAAGRPDLVYVDAWSVFAVDGAYAAYLDGGAGPALVRQEDGIHLTRAGGDLLAAEVLEAIEGDWLEE